MGKRNGNEILAKKALSGQMAKRSIKCAGWAQYEYTT